jgi:hypothetical protein
MLQRGEENDNWHQEIGLAGEELPKRGKEEKRHHE